MFRCNFVRKMPYYLLMSIFLGRKTNSKRRTSFQLRQEKLKHRFKEAVASKKTWKIPHRCATAQIRTRYLLSGRLTYCQLSGDCETAAMRYATLLYQVRWGVRPSTHIPRWVTVDALNYHWHEPNVFKPVTLTSTLQCSTTPTDLSPPWALFYSHIYMDILQLKKRHRSMTSIPRGCNFTFLFPKVIYHCI